MGDFTREEISITTADSPSVGPFGRLKVTSTKTLWDHKNIHSSYSDLWNEPVSGSGSVSHLPNEAAVAMTVGTDSGAYAMRSTRRYLAYASGNGHNPFASFVFPPPQANQICEVGYYDGPADPTGATWGNGIGLRRDNTEVSFFIRSDVNENPLGAREVNENVIPQSSWNIDKLDGTGPSGLTLDLSKSEIFDPDFQWLGVGRVRFLLNINGKPVEVHEENHSNILTSVYMRTPTLPIRYMIRNTGVTSTVATLKEICSSVKSEGDYTIPGVEYSVDTGGINARRPLTVAEEPVLIVRLANTINGMKNRKTVRFLESAYSAATRGALVRVAHIHDYSAIDATWRVFDGSIAGAVNGTPGVVTGDSGIEYAYTNAAGTGNPAITGGERHFIKPIYCPSGQAGRALTETSDVTFINNHSYLSQNFDSTESDVFAFFASGDGGASEIWAAFDFIEFE